MKSQDKSAIDSAELLLHHNTSNTSANHQNIHTQPIKSRINDGFIILLRSGFLLVLLAILFVAAIYYGIINP